VGIDVSSLVQRALDRDPGAWEALVDEFGDLVWAVARGQGLAAADAADVSQTTWLRLTEHLGRIREPDHVGAWLASTARNESLRTLKKAQRQVPTDWDANAGRAVGSDDGEHDRSILRDERNAALWRAFDALSGPCKVLLRCLMAEPEPSYAQVSEVLDIPVGTIGPRRNRCLESLRRNPGVTGHREVITT